MRGFGNARYGGRIGKDIHFRVYGVGFDRDNTVFRGGRNADTAWSLGQGGFRADWLPASGASVRMNGNFYGGDIGKTGPGDVSVDGQNLIGRWTQPLANDSEVSAQMYWDRTHRRIPGAIAEVLNTYNTIVGFVTEQSRIKLRINVKAAAASRLVLDARLLRAAEIVDE